MYGYNSNCDDIHDLDISGFMCIGVTVAILS